MDGRHRALAALLAAGLLQAAPVVTVPPAWAETGGATAAGDVEEDHEPPIVSFDDLIVRRLATIGRTPLQLHRLMKAALRQDEGALAEVRELSGGLKITEPALLRLFAMMEEDKVPVRRLPEQLAALSNRHKVLLKHLKPARNQEDAEIAELTAQAATEAAAGRYERTRKLLIRAKSTASARRMPAGTGSGQTAGQTAGSRGAELAALLGELANLRSDFAAAAKAFGEAATLAKAGDPNLRADYLSRASRAIESAGQEEKAIALQEEAAAIREKTLGPDHERTGMALKDLAYLYREQGWFDKAEPLYRRALAISERTPGPDNHDTAVTAMSFARAYWGEGRFAEAEQLYRHALAIDEKTLGPEHIATANSLGKLADLCLEQGRLEEAEPLLDRIMAIGEKNFGPDHIAMTIHLDTMAGLNRRTGRLDEAERLLLRALAIREKALYPNDPETAVNLADLASLYKNQGRLAKAEPLFNRALAIYEKNFGSNHPETLGLIENLAELYRDQGRPEDAAALAARAQVIRGKGIVPRFRI